MICIPKLALEIQDLLLPVTVLLPRLDDKSCKADPNLWLKAVTRPEDNVHYYTYILCYDDDILCIHHDPMSVMNEINGYLPLKPSSVGDPDIYLGAKLKQNQLPKWRGNLVLQSMLFRQLKIANCT